LLHLLLRQLLHLLLHLRLNLLLQLRLQLLLQLRMHLRLRLIHLRLQLTLWLHWLHLNLVHLWVHWLHLRMHLRQLLHLSEPLRLHLIGMQCSLHHSRIDRRRPVRCRESLFYAHDYAEPDSRQKQLRHG